MQVQVQVPQYRPGLVQRWEEQEAKATCLKPPE